MTEEKQETYHDLVSVDVGIEDDIGIFGNLMANVSESQPESETGIPSEPNRKGVKEQSKQ